MRTHRLRELLKQDLPSMGTRLQSQWPTMVEIIGHTGVFDYVELVAEYAPYTLFTLENMGRAIDLFDHMTGMIKIEQESRQHLAVRALGSGIQNALFSDIRTAAEAEECVRSVRAETPQTGGLHGARHGRDVGIMLEAGSAAFVQALEDSVVALMIEKKEAIENLEAILAVKGVDMVQFGPGDYAMSIGKAGEKRAPEVIEAQKYMIECALKKGVAPRAELNNPGEAEYYMNLGVKHFCLGADVTTVYNWSKENGLRLRNMLKSA
jgi:4-hydroxy-2-oxoheptanedioate aldolase